MEIQQQEENKKINQSISDIETTLYRYEKGMKLYKKVRKLGFFGKIKYLLSGNTDQK